MNCIRADFPVLHYLLEIAQINVHEMILPTSLLTLNLSQHQSLFHSVSSSNQMAKVLELQLQHLSFWGIFRVDFL